MNVTIDKSAGFCWGVVRTIDIVEESLEKNPDDDLYVLGHIIHNPKEVNRLEGLGLKTVTKDNLESLADQNKTVLIRAHGEPPSTYERAKKMGINVIDATCPLVTNLQNRIKKYYDKGWQIVIFGKENHPEVIGVRGVINDDCIVFKTVDEALEKTDFTRKTILFSQTTMDKRTFYEIKAALEAKASEFMDGGDVKDAFQTKDSLCRFVTGREDDLKAFAESNDVVVFVAGRNSSNGKSLYNFCKSNNEKTYFIEDIEELDYNWLDGAGNVGISGATSTPEWFMLKVKENIDEYFKLSLKAK
jgi:4-hydroxy-3-methylbut-2-en-1-yl diphosphate reductase